jgi:mono/diheme cytochrome c family protein
MRDWRRRWTVAAAALAALLVAGGCRDDGGDGGPAAQAHEEAVEDAGPAPGQLPENVSADEGREGRRLYREGCVMCHGEEGGGTQLGPSLVDGEWRLAEDGSFEAIMQVVQAGVESPEDFPVPMPSAEAARLSQEQVRAVAAYAFSLGRREP